MTARSSRCCGLAISMRPGSAPVNFIMPPGALTSNCHVMRAYQDRAYLGEY